MDTILLIDPWPILAAGVANLLREAGMQNPVDQVCNMRDATKALAGRPGLVMMDPSLPGAADSFVLLAQRQQPNLPILFFSGRDSDIYLSLAHKLGISGYLNKDCDATTLVAAVRMALSGMQCFPRQNAGAAQIPSLAHMSRRELLVLQLLRRGLRNKDIAQCLCLSPKTVSSHKRSLERKLGAPALVPPGLAAASDAAGIIHTLTNGLLGEKALL
jgi:two-component system response regulator FimZ (fimbrial Z protein)/two-component system response regulator EvgA